jgi:hypothetical protein
MDTERKKNWKQKERRNVNVNKLEKHGNRQKKINVLRGGEGM